MMAVLLTSVILFSGQSDVELVEPPRDPRIQGPLTSTWNRVGQNDLTLFPEFNYGQWLGNADFFNLLGGGGVLELARSFQPWLRVGISAGFWWLQNSAGQFVWSFTVLSFSGQFYLLWDLFFRVDLGLGGAQAVDDLPGFPVNALIVNPTLSLGYELRLDRLILTPIVGVRFIRTNDFEQTALFAGVGIGFNWESDFPE